MAVGLDALLGLACADSAIFDFDALVDEAALLVEGIVLAVAIGEVLAAGEKLILVWRLRSRAFLAMFWEVAVEVHSWRETFGDIVARLHVVALAPRFCRCGGGATADLLAPRNFTG
jgi:hypothetical protein